MSAVLSIYFQEITGSYALAMSVFSVCGLSQAALEIPTGVFSDKIGRRQTLILSAFLVLICLIMWAVAGETNCIFLLFVGAVLYGASDAFMSGTVDALIFETLSQAGREQEFKKLYAACRICNQAGLLTGVLIGAAFQAVLLMVVGVLADSFGVRNTLFFIVTGRLIAALISVLAAKKKK